MSHEGNWKTRVKRRKIGLRSKQTVQITNMHELTSIFLDDCKKFESFSTVSLKIVCANNFTFFSCFAQKDKVGLLSKVISPCVFVIYPCRKHSKYELNVWGGYLSLTTVLNYFKIVSILLQQTSSVTFCFLVIKLNY